MKGALLLLILLQTVVKVDAICRSIERNTGCPYSWQAWRDHCYLSVTHLHINFNLTEDHCQGLSNSGRPAYLASVTSDEEHQFIGDYVAVSMVSHGFWIGYRYELGFSWTDGTANTGFSSWADGQPNSGLGTGAKCVNLFRKRWNVQWCTNPRNFVCKMARLA